MDSNKTNENIDYSFITDTPGVPIKSNNKKLVILIAVSLLVVVSFLISLVFSSQRSISNEYDTVTKNHWELVANDQIEQSVQMYANHQQIDREIYDLFWKDFVSKKYNLINCEISSSEKVGNSIKVRVFCPFQNSKEGHIIVYDIDPETKLINRVDNEALSNSDK